MVQTNATTVTNPAVGASDNDLHTITRPDRVANYFDLARKSSVVMQLARKVPLGISGNEIVVQTGKASASWVAEAGQKPTTESQLGLKSFRPAKIAAISVVSAEVVRANPGSYMEVLQADIAEAFAVAFDNAVLHGTNTPFAGYLDQTTKSVELGTSAKADGGVYADIVAGLSTVVKTKNSLGYYRKVNGFAFDKSVEPTFLGAVDTVGRPLFSNATYEAGQTVTPGAIIGRPALMGDNIATDVVSGTPNTGGIVGYGGDWSQIVWGQIGGITFDVSTEASVTIGSQLKSLWEYNLVAIRVEAEFGILINDIDSFVTFTDNTANA